jgi:hypothetical protein
VFQELKWYLTSLPVMVAPEPSEPLMLYVAATSEVVSMVLVAERPEPQQPQVLKGASIGSSGSQDPEPTEEPRVEEAVGSQLPKASLALDHQEGSHSTTGSQLMEAALVLDDQGAIGSQLPEAVLDLGGQESPGPETMEVDATEPPPPQRVWTIQCPIYYISEVLHDTKTRYLEVHKLLYAVLIASSKLRH